MCVLYQEGGGSFDLPDGSYPSLGVGDSFFSVACPVGGIGSGVTSRASFLLLSPSSFPFSVGSCSILGFGDFLSFGACILGGIGSGITSRVYF